MAKSGVSINWSGLDKAIFNAAVNIKKEERLLNDLAVMLHRNTIKRFEKEESPDGKKWKKSQRAIEQNGQTLSNSGNLKKNISYAVKGNSAIVGTNVIYARIHQFGGMIKPNTKKALSFKRGNKKITVNQVKMPARPFIGVSRDDIDEAKHIISNFIKDSFKG